MNDHTRGAVQHALASVAGGPVAVRDVRAVSAAGGVWRCGVEGGDAVLPRSVIVKARRTDPRDPRSARDCLGVERAALEHLRALGVDFTPGVVAADGAGEVLVIEDRGPVPSLAQVLLGDDAQAAADGMDAFAASLGQLHARTGDGGAWSRWGGAEVQQERLSLAYVDIAASWAALPALVSEVGMPPAPDGALEREVAGVLDTLRDPGEWLALSSGDPCPGNALVGGRGGGATLIDFEMAAMRHALLDAAALRFPFPHCTPWGRVPEGVVRRAERAYRRALGVRIRAATDDGAYFRALCPAMAAWVIVRLVRLRRIDTDDAQAARRRTQIVRTIEAFLGVAAASGCLPHLAAWMGTLVGVMRTRWAEARQPAPMYPAFERP